MQQNNCDLVVLVKNRAVDEYQHNGRLYIEGREGSEYEIEFRNNNPFRVEAIFSVDGLSVLDGAEAGPSSRGYMVPARGSIRVPGWTLDKDNVARFQFGQRSTAYATQATGSTRNTGTIGVLVYRERVVQPHWPAGVGIVGGPAWPTQQHYYNTTGAAPIGGGAFRGIVPKGGGADDVLRSANIGAAVTYSASVAAQNTVQQDLGTQFGRADQFKTHEVQFTRGDLQVLMQMFYDSSRGLKARGIEIARPSRQRYQTEPDAFPGMSKGCTPPPGWKG